MQKPTYSFLNLHCISIAWLLHGPNITNRLKSVKFETFRTFVTATEKVKKIKKKKKKSNLKN